MMKKIAKELRPALVCFLGITILCGIVYPLLVTGIAQMAFPNQANGSIITITQANGTKADVGSALIGQEFTRPEYLIGRPMGVTNLAPFSEKQAALVQGQVNWWHALDLNTAGEIPMDLVTASGSGVDPNISPEAAEYQVTRIASARGLSQDEVRAVINQYTTGRFMDFWGESGVNVLKVNLALDGLI
jgi:K+-transporting ATPase ATPase C chain